MKNKYHLILAAGSRVGGAVKFGSITEQLHHEQHVKELKQELGASFIQYFSRLGFILVELTEEEAAQYVTDPRILEVSECKDYSVCTNFSTRDTTTHDLWFLEQLSNRLFATLRILSGFNLELKPTVYGVVGVDSCTRYHDIATCDLQNKLVYDNVTYRYFVASTGISVAHVFSTNTTLPIDTDLYLVYNIIDNQISLKTSVEADSILLYTVKVKLYQDNQSIYWSGSSSGILGFYDLKPVKQKERNYAMTVQGEGVDIIIGDTQINPTIAEFEGRASLHSNVYSDRYVANYGAWDSTNPLISEHGTFVASLAAGSTCGIAPKAKITGITCLDDSADRGNKSDRVVAAFDNILQYIDTKKTAAGTKPYPIVVNFSLGSVTNSHDLAMDAAVQAMITDGAVVVIAAGNDNWYRNHSPYATDAIIVGATNIGVEPTDFTDYGQEVTLYAPGTDIYGASNVNGTYHRSDGTSYSAPLVAGLCALYLSLYPEATPQEVKAAILNNAIEAVTCNKASTTYLFAQSPVCSYIDRQLINTPALREDLIYTAIPYLVGFDGERIYGSLHELTISQITSAVVSAGKSASIDLATSIRLVP